MVEIGQENQRGKSQAWFFEPWYFKDWWIECVSEGKDTFSYDSYMWKVIHTEKRIWVWKRKSRVHSRYCGWWYRFVCYPLQDKSWILSRIKAETLNQHAAELIPTNAIVLLPLFYRHQAFLKSKKKISWSG